ncbi:MAG: hypothetical protein JOZ60_03725 [Verrucomicrobia bacterium]|nr:hypothetical protein [Verrucomicrobiota bacterium]
MGKHSSPGPQEKRFTAYIDGLARAAGHADRATPLKTYCKGLLLPEGRKSVEPMAACLAADESIIHPLERNRENPEGLSQQGCFAVFRET